MKLKDFISQGLANNADFFSDLKIRKKLNEYARQNNINELYAKVHNNFNPVFVLSTGRCGTAFLTLLLDKSKEINAFHEPHPEFFYHTILAYNEYKKSPDKVETAFDIARYELIRNSFIDNKKYVETNNRVTFFANQIAKLYPKAKFIHLIRNPSSFIKSGLSRNWYSGHTLYDEGRITGNSGDWNNFSQIQKIAWLWEETNCFIEEFKSNVEKERVLVVKSEELFKSVSLQREIFKFIGVNSLGENLLKRISSKKVNQGGSISLDASQKEEIASLINKSRLASTYGYLS